MKNPNDRTGALKGGDSFVFFLTSIVAKHQKIQGGPLRKKYFEKKSYNAEQN